MPKFLIRLIAALLVPSLVADPSASALARPDVWRAATPHLYRIDQTPFQEQTLALVPLDQRRPLLRTIHYWSRLLGIHTGEQDAAQADVLLDDDLNIADIGLSAGAHSRVNKQIRRWMDQRLFQDFLPEEPEFRDIRVRLVGTPQDKFLDERTGQRAHAGGLSTVGTRNEEKYVWMALGAYLENPIAGMGRLRHEAFELRLWWQKAQELLLANQIRAKDNHTSNLPTFREWLAQHSSERRALKKEYHNAAQAVHHITLDRPSRPPALAKPLATAFRRWRSLRKWLTVEWPSYIEKAPVDSPYVREYKRQHVTGFYIQALEAEAGHAFQEAAQHLIQMAGGMIRRGFDEGYYDSEQIANQVKTMLGWAETLLRRAPRPRLARLEALRLLIDHIEELVRLLRPSGARSGGAGPDRQHTPDDEPGNSTKSRFNPLPGRQPAWTRQNVLGASEGPAAVRYMTEPKESRKPCVLVVDPSLLLRELARFQFRYKGFDVVMAETRQQAIDALAAGPGVDIVLSGHNLSEGDGLELLQDIQRNHPKTPIVIWTNEPLDTVQVPLARAGAMRVLPKRLGLFEVAKVLREVLQAPLSGQETGSKDSGAGPDTKKLEGEPIKRLVGRRKRSDFERGLLGDWEGQRLRFHEDPEEPRKPRVLIVEPSPMFSDLTQSRFRLEGFEVTAVETQAEAMQLLAAKPAVDLVVSELHLPDGHGLGLLRNLKKKYPTIPVVIWTGEPLNTVEGSLTRAGAARVLQKPFSLREVTRVLREVLASREKHKPFDRDERLKRARQAIEGQILQAASKPYFTVYDFMRAYRWEFKREELALTENQARTDLAHLEGLGELGARREAGAPVHYWVVWEKFGKVRSLTPAAAPKPKAERPPKVRPERVPREQPVLRWGKIWKPASVQELQMARDALLQIASRAGVGPSRQQLEQAIRLIESGLAGISRGKEISPKEIWKEMFSNLRQAQRLLEDKPLADELEGLLSRGPKETRGSALIPAVIVAGVLGWSAATATLLSTPPSDKGFNWPAYVTTLAASFTYILAMTFRRPMMTGMFNRDNIAGLLPQDLFNNQSLKIAGVVGRTGQFTEWRAQDRKGYPTIRLYRVRSERYGLWRYGRSQVAELVRGNIVQSRVLVIEPKGGRLAQDLYHEHAIQRGLGRLHVDYGLQKMQPVVIAKVTLEDVARFNAQSPISRVLQHLPLSFASDWRRLMFGLLPADAKAATKRLTGTWSRLWPLVLVSVLAFARAAGAHTLPDPTQIQIFEVVGGTPGKALVLTLIGIIAARLFHASRNSFSKRLPFLRSA